MTTERWVLAFLIVVAASIQYGLIVYTVRDLLRRPSVRHNNKVAWGLLIVGIPFIGPLVYAVMGPTGFMPRPNRPPRASISVLDDNDLQ